MVAVSCFTNISHSQIADKLWVLQGSRMFSYGLQVCRSFWLVKHVKVHYGWCKFGKMGSRLLAVSLCIVVFICLAFEITQKLEWGFLEHWNKMINTRPCKLKTHADGKRIEFWYFLFMQIKPQLALHSKRVVLWFYLLTQQHATIFVLQHLCTLY